MQRTSRLTLSFILSCLSCGAPMAGSTPTSSSESSSAEAAGSDAPPAEAPRSDGGWKTFTYAPGVTVEMPGTPVDAGVAGVFGLKRGEGRGLSVQCMESGNKKERADTLAGMRRGIIGERKLLSEKKVTRGSATGIRLDIATETTAGTTKMHVLLLSGQERSCTFISIASGDSADESDTERFLGSAKVE